MGCVSKGDMHGAPFETRRFAPLLRANGERISSV